MTTMLRTMVLITILTMANIEAGSAQSRTEVLLVANQGDHTISLLDPASGNLLKNVRTNGDHAHEIAVSPDARLAYLPIYGDSGVGRPGTDGRTIEVLDFATHTITHIIDLGRPTRPHWAGFGADGMLYVSAELAEAMDVIDPKTLKVVASNFSVDGKKLILKLRSPLLESSQRGDRPEWWSGHVWRQRARSPSYRELSLP